MEHSVWNKNETGFLSNGLILWVGDVPESYQGMMFKVENNKMGPSYKRF